MGRNIANISTLVTIISYISISILVDLLQKGLIQTLLVETFLPHVFSTLASSKTIKFGHKKLEKPQKLGNILGAYANRVIDAQKFQYHLFKYDNLLDHL